mmetsp:Transcript_72386/g.125496  ORF Transcript_72386/g.125496 Transcript_72386/m.125496 type:complete len:776 (+) Transcript_72386:151-2478(+)
MVEMPEPPTEDQIDEARLNEVELAVKEFSQQTYTTDSDEDEGSVPDDDSVGSVPDESGGVPEESESKRIPASSRKFQVWGSSPVSPSPSPRCSPRRSDPDELNFEFSHAVEQYLPVRAVPRTLTKQQIFSSSCAEDVAMVSAASEKEVAASSPRASRSDKCRLHVAPVSSEGQSQAEVNAVIEAAVQETVWHADFISEREDQVQSEEEIRINTHQFEDTSTDWRQLLSSDAREYSGAFPELQRECSYNSFTNDSTGLRVAGELPQISSGASYFDVQEIEVHEPPEQDGSLGLLLSGNTVVAFTCPEAQAAGWRLGDVIVKVNGRSCEHFNQFVQILAEARNDGFPIVFSVLRCEILQDQLDTECDLDDMVNLTNVVERAEQMQFRPGFLHGALVDGEKTVLKPSDWRLQGPVDWRLQGLSMSESVFENPYVDALRKRRINLDEKHAEGWNSCGDMSAREDSRDSLASRLATQREGVASLTSKQDPKPRKLRGPSWYPMLCASEEEPADPVSTFATQRDFAELMRKGPLVRKQDSPCGALILCAGEDEGIPNKPNDDEKGIPRLKMSQESRSHKASEAKSMQFCCKPEIISPVSTQPSAHRPPSLRMEPCNSPDGEPEVAKESGPSGCLSTVMEVCTDSEVTGAPNPDNPFLLAEISVNSDAGQPAQSESKNTDPSDDSGPLDVDMQKFTEAVPKALTKGQKRIKAARKPRLETVEEHPFGNYNEDDEEEDESELVVFRKSLAARSSPGFFAMSSTEDPSSRNFAMKLVGSWGPAG